MGGRRTRFIHIEGGRDGCGVYYLYTREGLVGSYDTVIVDESELGTE